MGIQNEMNTRGSGCWTTREDLRDMREMAAWKDDDILTCRFCTVKPIRCEYDEHMKIHQDKIEKEQLQKKLEYVKQKSMPFGKYKGQTLGDIYTKDKKYFKWLSTIEWSHYLLNDNIQLILSEPLT